jgi:hypothetical protein
VGNGAGPRLRRRTSGPPLAGPCTRLNRWETSRHDDRRPWGAAWSTRSGAETQTPSRLSRPPHARAHASGRRARRSPQGYFPVSATFAACARVFGCGDRTARSGAVSSAPKFDSRSRSRRQHCPSSLGNNSAPGRLGFGTCPGGAPEIGRSDDTAIRPLGGACCTNRAGDGRSLGLPADCHVRPLTRLVSPRMEWTALAESGT